MNFALNETQRMLSDSVARYLEHEASASGYLASQWSQFAELGVLGLTVAEHHGGMGATAVDTAIVMEQLGRAAASSPYAYAVVLAATLLTAGSPSQQDHWLGRLASGEEFFTCALYETHARHELLPLATKAERGGDGLVLNGAKSNVWHAEQATQVIVAAQYEGSPALFVLPTDTAGLQWHHFPTVDGGSAAELRLDKVRVTAEQRLEAGGTPLPVIRLAERRATAALAAEAVGLMSAILDSTRDYLRQRQQFGQAIGSFQALQHRMVDMLIELEQARSLAWYAAATLDSASDAAQQRAVSAAKARTGRAARLLSQESIQLHGGMGMTEELPLSRYVKRLLAIEHSLGDTAFHLERFSKTEA